MPVISTVLTAQLYQCIEACSQNPQLRPSCLSRVSTRIKPPLSRLTRTNLVRIVLRCFLRNATKKKMHTHTHTYTHTRQHTQTYKHACTHPLSLSEIRLVTLYIRGWRWFLSDSARSPINSVQYVGYACSKSRLGSCLSLRSLVNPDFQRLSGKGRGKEAGHEEPAWYLMLYVPCWYPTKPVSAKLCMCNNRQPSLSTQQVFSLASPRNILAFLSLFLTSENSAEASTSSHGPQHESPARKHDQVNFEPHLGCACSKLRIGLAIVSAWFWIL